MKIINSHQYQKGFSMIELLVVIVIIGVLGGIALPTYKDYIVKAKVIEIFALAQPTKLAVMEALAFNTPAKEVDSTTLGLPALVNKEKIQDISVSRGIVTITVNHRALDLSLPQDQAFKIAFTPTTEDGNIRWNCTTEPHDFKKYVPQNCRH